MTTCAFERLPDAPADVVVLCRPNNPTGTCLAPAQIRRTLASLTQRRGWLIVDEAYVDATPEASLLPTFAPEDWERVVVLRSLGKFFGLAGARAGFAIGSAPAINALREELGPWALSGPTRAAAAQALGDPAWHAGARTFLHDMVGRLDACLRASLGVQPAGCPLFRWFEHARADALADHLARAAILVRTFAAPPGGKPSLRFGLPADDAQLARLAAALETFR